ncbi:MULTISPECIES: hypothetical protein [unclassified Burkholderia]|uniref:hypothetical protein n=1 Tax=unclassified Burkholderia TaxID=2613784 RepID=UPI0014246AC3|nr:MULTISPECIES: hypothetical protein [unclassified Burkholderia]NIE83023.1 hypothetical protein [Burkholderia sp. Tr-860]NIF62120.1 hypothetical protein [Burkholderia sp. Cy-647]NIF96260.1 hypothetical protein [Burkholderia sp. Ax-1720]
MTINASDGEPDRNAVRLERQIARANQALASVEAGYYVTDDEIDKNPEASRLLREPLLLNWV